MTILDYYLNMQQNKNWVNKFVSTSSNQSGKIFSYVNTNFRGVYSFFEQVLKFNKKNTLPRSEWNDKQNKGQEKDKHRVINLIRAGFFEFEQTDLSYIITPKGQTILDIKDEKLNKEEIWLLLYLLLIDYKNEENNFDILNSTKKLFIDLEGYGYSREKIINLIREGVKSKDKKELFMKDIFWLITFQKDDNFLDCFSKSKSEDITSLKWHVIKDNEMNNEDDCIVHKFINGGVYTVSTFKDDLKVLYLTDIFLNYHYENFDAFVKNVIDEYSQFCYDFKKDLVLNFIRNHHSIYEKNFKAVKGCCINKNE